MALRADGQLRDLSWLQEAPPEATVEALTFQSPEGREVFRHSAAHVLAHAVKELFPQAKLAIGPPTEDGFYYDFDVPRPFSPQDLERIEQKMRRIIKKNHPFVRKTLSRSEAVELFRRLGEDYKVELLQEMPDEEVSIYEEGGFVDLCRGPHVPSTGLLKAVKLLSVAGAYWKGQEQRKMLQRIYGTAYPSEEALKEHLLLLQEAKRRDHRRLGKELELFSIQEEVGPGLILWHPNGAIIRHIIEDFWKEEHLRAGYQLLYTPHVAKLQLWQRSGHWDFYRENMFSPMQMEGLPYELKPMNCPFHIMVYKSALRSYRDLPLRYAELGTVYRFERSGVLHGLLRVRGFTQDDAHIFLSQEQLEEEILQVLRLTLQVLRTFGFEHYEVYLSTMPEKHVGSPQVWELATQALQKALQHMGLEFQVDPGEGVFYGPKIDIKVKDCLGRPWQCSTVQVDFNIPERFDLTYRGPDGREHRPIMIHRALMGSLERFFGILIEHYAGAFPLWLAPRQVEVLSIAERHAPYAQKVLRALRAAGLRAEANLEAEKIGYKVRSATVRKVPYLVIIGDREVAQESISVRRRDGQNIGPLPVEEFIKMLQEEIARRR